MSSLRRLMHQPINTLSRLFPSPAICTHDYKIKLSGSSPIVPSDDMKDAQFYLKNGSRPTIQNCGSMSTSSCSSTIRLSIFQMQVSRFSTGKRNTPPKPDESNCAAGNESGTNVVGGGDSVSFAETKKLMRLANVVSLKMKLGMDDKEVIGYSELLEACQRHGVAKSKDDAIAFAQVLDEAGSILLFRDKVYLHPDKVVDLVRRAVPLALTTEDDPRRGELKKLQEEKEEIDVLAHKQVRRILWAGLGASVLQVGLFFRLTFWEFSWDVMEPIAFFTTAAGIVVGYAYFLFTSRDPSYQDLMKRLLLSRQRKLFKRQRFDVNRFLELQKTCKSPLDISRGMKNKVSLDLEPDTFHAH